MRRARNEMRLRAMMNDFGVQEVASQDALVAYLAEDEAGKSVVRAAARRLMAAVRNGAPPAHMHDLLAIYKAAIDADRERRHAAQTALDAKIGFSLSPRLEALLWLFGVLGESQTALSFNALVARSPKKLADEQEQKGVVVGTVTKKDEAWIEVQPEPDATNPGAAEPGAYPDAVKDQNAVKPNVSSRYFPLWLGEGHCIDPISGAPLGKEEVALFNRTLAEFLARVHIGERVSLRWVGNKRKFMVGLEIMPPLLAPNPDANAAPADPGDETVAPQNQPAAPSADAPADNPQDAPYAG